MAKKPEPEKSSDKLYGAAEVLENIAKGHAEAGDLASAQRVSEQAAEWREKANEFKAKGD